MCPHLICIFHLLIFSKRFFRLYAKLSFYLFIVFVCWIFVGITIQVWFDLIRFRKKYFSVCKWREQSILIKIHVEMCQFTRIPTTRLNESLCWRFFLLTDVKPLRHKQIFVFLLNFITFFIYGASNFFIEIKCIGYIYNS